ncbi:hypothetical protein LY78DRAFT_727934, partial [Colletotrichum sublineola]
SFQYEAQRLHTSQHLSATKLVRREHSSNHGDEAEIGLYALQRVSDDKIVARCHPLRRPLLVLSDEETRASFNSGGAGMFAKRREYTRILALFLNDGTCLFTKARILKKTRSTRCSQTRFRIFLSLAKAASKLSEPS